MSKLIKFLIFFRRSENSMTVYQGDKTLSRSLRKHYLELGCVEQFVRKFRSVGLSVLMSSFICADIGGLPTLLKSLISI
jgi:hypothetical protein